MFNVATALASNTAAKVAGGALAAVLTVGGTAAVTGNLPDDLQCFTADAAAHVGLTLPRPHIAVEVTESADALVGDVINVGEAGQILVAIDGPDLGTTGAGANAALEVCAASDNDAGPGPDIATTRSANASGDFANGDNANGSSDNSDGSTLTGRAGDLRITGIVANDGYSAEVLLQTSDSALVEFRSDTETTSVLIGSIDGSIVSSVNFELNADAEANADDGASASAWLNAWINANPDLDVSGWLMAWISAHRNADGRIWLNGQISAEADVADINGSAWLNGYATIEG